MSQGDRHLTLASTRLCPQFGLGLKVAEELKHFSCNCSGRELGNCIREVAQLNELGRHVFRKGGMNEKI
jgi:hypothetical protein